VAVDTLERGAEPNVDAALAKAICCIVAEALRNLAEDAIARSVLSRLRRSNTLTVGGPVANRIGETANLPLA